MCNPTKTIQQPSWLSQPQQKGRTQHILHFQRRHCAKRLRQRVVCPLLNLNHSKVREITNSSVLKSEFIFFAGHREKHSLSASHVLLSKRLTAPLQKRSHFLLFSANGTRFNRLGHTLLIFGNKFPPKESKLKLSTFSRVPHKFQPFRFFLCTAVALVTLIRIRSFLFIFNAKQKL